MDWIPTHAIDLGEGVKVKVMLADGAAYTRAEWLAGVPADYERDDNGDWLFQGQPFAGRVVAVCDEEEER